jgi:coenzyme F420-reducing hydrogenase delta subunit
MGFVPEIVILYCQHAAADQHQAVVASQQATGLSIRPKMMPCSSKIEVPHLLRILEQGADAVELVACPEGACRFLVGNQKAEKRVRYASELLQQAGVGSAVERGSRPMGC